MSNTSLRRWRFFKRETIVLSRPDDGTEGELHRWRLIETPLGGIMLHRHMAPDPGRVLHDHPWSFVSLILRGGYVEEVAETRKTAGFARQVRRRLRTTYGEPRHRRALTLRGVRLDQAHRIVQLDRQPTWTLVVHGPRRRIWGFYTEDGFIDERRVDWERVDLIGAAASEKP